MRFSGIEKKLSELEHGLHGADTPTTDKNGQRAWLRNSGICTYRELLRAERAADEAGRDEVTIEDLSPELAEQIDLWSRAELGADCGALAEMLRAEARRIMGVDT